MSTTSGSEPLDLYETYIRDKDGVTYYISDLREGIKQFLSGEGYRLSFNIDGVVITLRRGSVSDELRYLDTMLAQASEDCAVTFQGISLAYDGENHHA